MKGFYWNSINTSNVRIIQNEWKFCLKENSIRRCSASKGDHFTSSIRDIASRNPVPNTIVYPFSINNLTIHEAVQGILIVFE